MNTRELRARQGGIELRQVTDDEKKAGYIGSLVGEIPYASDSQELRDRGVNRGQPFVERLAPDAFKRSLEEDKDQMAFAGHTDDPLAAFARVGENLTITSSERGLTWRALIPDTQAGRDMVTLTQRGIIKGTSFEFTLNDGGDSWEKRDGKDVRTINNARLYTVNPVAFPAYPGSELTAERSLHRKAKRRGLYAYSDAEYDPSMTCDARYACDALCDELDELADAIDYLRCLQMPDTTATGALKDYAQRELAESAKSVAELTAWLAANGATVNPDVLDRANKTLTEARAASAQTISENAGRQRRTRILPVPAVSPLL